MPLRCTLPRLSRLLPYLALPFLVLVGLPAGAFNSPPPEVTVTEFKNHILNHYFMTASAEEMAAIDAGAAGPGWVRTGYGFATYGSVGPFCGGCVPVSRFYGPGPNSHFYTENESEAEGLKQPGTGWLFERVEFAVTLPVNGQCVVPVYRLYNNRFAFNDSNHRYVTSASERAAMLAEGWIDEGVQFCAFRAVEVPLKSFEMKIDLDSHIMPSASCEDERINLGGCMAVNNLPVPNVSLGPYMYAAQRRMFTRSTGIETERVHAPAFLAPEMASKGLFVHGWDIFWGLNVDSRARGPSVYSSVNPLYQLRTSVPAGGADPRFFPWVGFAFDTQLSITAGVGVQRIEVRDAQSHAYGHPTLELIDQSSGHHVYFTVLAYGTIQPESDYLAPDVVTRKVIVGTTFRDGPYGRSLASSTLYTPSGTDQAAKGNGKAGMFEFRIDRGEFRHILESARTVDPALSAEPADYFLDNFHFTNEVVGDGEIGIQLSGFSLRVMRR